MKLGIEFPQKWREKSQETGIPLADILYGYAIEDIMQRIGNSSFYEYLWLANESALGEAAYCKKMKSRLEFFYVGEENHLELLEKEIFSEKVSSNIVWTSNVKNRNDGVEISLVGTYKDMQVPISIWIDTSQRIKKKSKEKNRLLFMDEKKSFTYFSYTRESILAEDIFEIVRKLELITDMGCYDRINEILKNYSLSGRYIIEDFKTMGQNESKVVTMKRLEQITSYKDYGYMKKKWQQYAKNRYDTYDDWEIVMRRVIHFLCPIWTALCKDEIFLDDWMPELERFLE